eukprot:TRINITY_DN2723_c0_g1_i1.p1 TRINITY_DN2723_c0_g1~~TRINITY_DN2723_c0_g1_i1.p1  ORF type:complete len:163 (+),score=67.00 TRINITY_DN2723_c0_g1_i1:107-595(+)
MGCGHSLPPKPDPKPVCQKKVGRIVDEFMDIDGNGVLCEAECLKFHRFMSNDKHATVEDMPEDTKDLIGMSSVEAKLKIQVMCNDADNLDFIIAKYEKKAKKEKAAKLAKSGAGGEGEGAPSAEGAAGEDKPAAAANGEEAGKPKPEASEEKPQAAASVGEK